jgi:hypothetical protein
MRLAATVDLAYGIMSKIALARLLSNFLAAAPTAAGISDIVSTRVRSATDEQSNASTLVRNILRKP